MSTKGNTYTRNELSNELRKWMLAQRGNPMDLLGKAQEQWYRDYGLIQHFITDHFAEDDAPDTLWDTLRAVAALQAGQPPVRRDPPGPDVVLLAGMPDQNETNQPLT